MSAVGVPPLQSRPPDPSQQGVKIAYLGPPVSVKVPDGIPTDVLNPGEMLAYFGGHWQKLPLGAAPPIGKQWATVGDPAGMGRPVVVEVPGWRMQVVSLTDPTPTVIDNQQVVTATVVNPSIACRLAFGAIIQAAAEYAQTKNDSRAVYEIIRIRPYLAMQALLQFDPSGRFVYDPVMNVVIDTVTGATSNSATG